MKESKAKPHHMNIVDAISELKRKGYYVVLEDIAVKFYFTDKLQVDSDKSEIEFLGLLNSLDDNTKTFVIDLLTELLRGLNDASTNYHKELCSLIKKD